MRATNFPTNQLAPLIALTDGLRNRPSFDQTVALLRELFVDILRYGADEIDVTKRVGLPPSARTRRVLSLAGAGGVRVCVVEREGLSFYPNTYLKLFRLYPDCLVFVHSNVDRRVRMLVRPRRSARHTYRYRSLTPRAVMGPRGDYLASWALRLGLLQPNISEPSHVNYAFFEKVLFGSPAELMALHDPFRWSNRAIWAHALGIPAWENRLRNVVHRFLQADRLPTERRAVGLHEALLRSFPIHIEADTRQKLFYDHYRVQAPTGENDDDAWRISLHLRLSVEARGVTTQTPICLDLDFPRMTSAGYLAWKGRLWRFRATAGLEISWDEGPPGEKTGGDDQDEELAAHDDNELSQTLAEFGVEELFGEDVVPEIEAEADATVLAFDELDSNADETDVGVQKLQFLAISRAFAYGVTRELRRLRWHLRNRSRDDEHSIATHVKCMVREWSLGRSRHEPRSILPHLFVQDYFEPVSQEGLKYSPLGQQLLTHAVGWNSLERPPWSCEVYTELNPHQVLPVAGAVSHPIRREFVADPHGERLCAAAHRATLKVGRARSADALRFERMANRWTSQRTLIVPGDIAGVAIRRGAFTTNSPQTLCSKMQRHLPAAAERIAAHSDDEHALDAETGVVRIGKPLHPGDIIARRIAGTELIPLCPEEKLFNAVITEEPKTLLPTVWRDRSWRAPAGAKGVVRRVSFEGATPAAAGVLTVHLEQNLALDIGAHIATDFGVSAPIIAHLSVEETPFLADGEPVDMLLTLPRSQFQTLYGAETGCTTAFDCHGEMIAQAHVVRTHQFSISSLPRACAQERPRRFNLRGRPLREKTNNRFSGLTLAAQLNAYSARAGLREFLGALSPDREPAVAHLQVAQRFEQLFAACGFDLRIQNDSASVALRAVGPADGVIVKKPTETLNYRTRRPVKDGLFDPLLFRSLPRSFLNAGGMTWTLEEPESSALGEQQMGPKDWRRDMKGRGPLRLGERFEPGRGLGLIELAEPIINPLLEQTLAEFLELDLDELVAVSCGMLSLLTDRDDSGRLMWWIDAAPDKDAILDRDFDEQPAHTGVRAVERLLEGLAEYDPKAARLQEAIWHAVPVLPPHWRPIVDGNDDIPWAMSDLNTLYVRVGHAAKRVATALKHPTVIPQAHLQATRRMLRDHLHALYGVAEDMPTTWVPWRRHRWEKSTHTLRGIKQLLAQFRRECLLVSETDALPFSVRGDWFSSHQTAGVSVPVEHLLACWHTSFAQHLFETGLYSSPQSAHQALKRRDQDATALCREILEADKFFGYLLTEGGALMPVRLTVARDQAAIGVNDGLATRLGLSPHEDVLLYLPPAADAQAEAQRLVARSVPAQTGELRVDPAGDPAAPQHFWRLAQVETLIAVAASPVEVHLDDFLSALCLARVVDDIIENIVEDIEKRALENAGHADSPTITSDAITPADLPPEPATSPHTSPVAEPAKEPAQPAEASEPLPIKDAQPAEATVHVGSLREAWATLLKNAAAHLTRPNCSPTKQGEPATEEPF